MSGNVKITRLIIFLTVSLFPAVQEERGPRLSKNRIFLSQVNESVNRVLSPGAQTFSRDVERNGNLAVFRQPRGPKPDLNSERGAFTKILKANICQTFGASPRFGASYLATSGE